MYVGSKSPEGPVCDALLPLSVWDLGIWTVTGLAGWRVFTAGAPLEGRTAEGPAGDGRSPSQPLHLGYDSKNPKSWFRNKRKLTSKTHMDWAGPNLNSAGTMWTKVSRIGRSPFEVSVFFWPTHTACGILVPRPGIEPRPPRAVEARSLNHWTFREVPEVSLWTGLGIWPNTWVNSGPRSVFLNWTPF